MAGINPESFHSKTMTSTFLRVSFKGPFAKSVFVVSVESLDIGKTLLLLLLWSTIQDLCAKKLNLTFVFPRRAVYRGLYTLFVQDE